MFGKMSVYPNSPVANVYGNSGDRRSERQNMVTVIGISKEEFDAHFRQGRNWVEYNHVTNIPEEKRAAITSDGHPYPDEA